MGGNDASSAFPESHTVAVSLAVAAHDHHVVVLNELSLLAAWEVELLGAHPA